jgi:hypothetical protein
MMEIPLLRLLLFFKLWYRHELRNFAPTGFIYPASCPRSFQAKGRDYAPKKIMEQRKNGPGKV